MCDSIRAEHALQKRQGSLVRRRAKTVDAKDPSGIGKRKDPPGIEKRKDPPGIEKRKGPRLASAEERARAAARVGA